MRVELTKEAQFAKIVILSCSLMRHVFNILQILDESLTESVTQWTIIRLSSWHLALVLSRIAHL